MKINILKRIFSVISIMAIMFTTLFSSFSKVQAVSSGDSVQIVNRGICDYHVKYLRDDGIYKYIVTHFVGYYEDNVFHPAYCLNMDLDGVTEDLSYSVNVQDTLDNDAVWRVLYHGYPYAGTLGLDNEADAFFVTKQAIYSVLDGRDVDNYQGADDEGDRMVAKIKELVNYGRYGTDTKSTPVITLTSVNESSVDDIDSNYISQTFKVDSPINSKDIRIYINGNLAPEGSVLTDMNNNAKTSFSKGEQFKVLVPRINITEAISIDITATGSVETYPVLFSQAPSSNLQNYALVSDPFVFTTTSTKMLYTEPKGEVTIDKVSKEYNQYTNLDAGSKLQGAIFEIERIDGKETYKEQFTTDELGKINQELKLGTYKLTEIKTPDYYVIGKEGATFEFTIKHDGQIVTIEVENNNVNLKVDVEKTGTVETVAGGEIEYNFDIQNKSNVAVNNFIWGDKLPSEVRIQKLITGTFNGNNNYKVQYITNSNTNWKTIKTCNSSESSEIALDNKTLGLADTEYVEEIRFVFEGDVKPLFQNNGTKIIATANSDLKDNQIIENHTYVTADYLQTKLEDKDEFHTIIQAPKQTSLSGVLPRTGK